MQILTPLRSTPPASLSLDHPSPQPSASDHEISDPEGGDEMSALQSEIDEQSDDEDDRLAHALLQATPNSSVDTPVQQTPSTAIQHSDHSFVVCT
jgi:hypothetical protein